MGNNMECDVCGETFDTEGELGAHLSRKHEDVNFLDGDRSSSATQSEVVGSDDGELPTNTKEVPVDPPESQDHSPQGTSGDSRTGAPERDTGASELESTDPVTGDGSESDGSDSPSDRVGDTTADGDADTESPAESVSLEGYLDGGDIAQAKWFLFGVGGCGGNLIDAVILRSETLRNGDRQLPDLWPRALRGLASVNSNNTEELYQTYYVQEYRDEDPETVTTLNSVGPPPIPGGGAVSLAGEELAKWVFRQDDKDFAGNKWGLATDHRRISDAQAVIFLHSSVKGTGSGATPVIARALDEALSPDEQFDIDILEPTATKYSISVLPNSGCGGLEKSNGLVSFARLVETMDAVIPVDNKNLADVREANESIAVDIEGTEGYQLHKHREANETLVSFLETFTFASVAGIEDGTLQGDGLDPTDTYRPAKYLYTDDDTGENTPAVVMAPAYGSIEIGRNKFDRTALENLVINALTEGKLIDFDHTTAWGGAFVVEAPSDQDHQINSVCDQNFREIIETPEALDIDTTGEEEGQMFPTRRYDLFRGDIETVRLWALIYNPEMRRLENWREWADKHRNGPEKYQQQLRERWEEIEKLFTLLGRKNRGSRQNSHE